MPLVSGTRLGPYEISSAIGAGGMGEVYKARDTRLERTVAIKILPSFLASDPEFRARFQREAQTISQLDHPNICAVYDVGEHDRTSFIVMQYLEGDTLAARIAKGPMQVEEALPIAIQIADALDKAHRAGVVHRDLKPQNIILIKPGSGRQQAKLLDFGLAKAAGAVNAGTSMATTPVGITSQGTILGTFQYMAPEQVEGQDADARTDIFAFGAVLYEMLTGRPAFQGKTQASLIGSVLRDEPAALSEIAPMVPPALARVIKTCLAKDPDDRFQTAHDISLQLKWILEGGSQAGVPAPVVTKRRHRERLAWVVAGLAIATTVGVAAWSARTPAPAPPRLMRFEIPTPEGVVVIDAPRLSPDGKYLAVNATDSEGKTRIWVRAMNSLAAQPLAGTDGTGRVFWSPDSRFIGFFADGRMKKIEATGGPAQKICDAPTGSDATWSPEGVILFDGTGTDPVRRCAASGGVASDIVKIDKSRKEVQVGWPEFLPDGKHFLYLAANEKPDDTMYRIGSIDSSETTPLMPAQTQVAYAPPGYLLFVRDRTLVAQPFEASTLKTTGEPVPLAERVGTDSVGLARFSVARDGTLVYRTGDSTARLLWIDRNGREIETLGDAGSYSSPALSRDGRFLAYGLTDSRTAKNDIWIRDLPRAVSSRLTFAEGDHITPVWAPDAAKVVFARVRGAEQDLYAKTASGDAEETLLLKTPNAKVPTDWSRDGRYILYISSDPQNDWDVWALPTFGDRKPLQVVTGPFAQVAPKFSPDARFIAYQSNESGRPEIYVRSFPAGAGKWQVSNGGGVDPAWGPDGKELLYRSADQKLMSVAVDTTGTFQASIPRPLFPSRVLPGVSRNKYVVTPDGQRVLFVAPLGSDALAPTTVVLNWFADLGR